MTDQAPETSVPASRGVRGPAARWGLLVVALLLGVGLIGSSVWSYRQARAIAEPLARGQAEAYLRALRERTRPELGPPTAAALEQLLSDHSAAGLRYLTLVDQRGQVSHAVGAPAVPALSTPPPGDLVYRDDRVRMTAPPAPPPPPPPPWLPHPGPRGVPTPSLASAGAPPGPAGTASPRLRPPPPHPPRHGPPQADHGSLVMEFEPLAARELIGRARLGVGVGIAAALVLMLAAAVFWRQSLGADRAERQLARQRHLAALGEMSAVMAHEIRNPLAAAKGHAQLLTEQLPAAEPKGERAQTVVAELERLEQLTGELLDFARTGTITRESVDPTELVAEAVAAVEGDALTLHLDDAPARWSLDPLRMGQALTNLLRNALDVEPTEEGPGGGVEATVRVAGGNLVVEVRDRGSGIDPTQRAHIFEAFHTTRVRGTGLGLAITRRIVHLHGGTIVGSNHPDGGALFRVTIPPDPDAPANRSEATA